MTDSLQPLWFKLSKRFYRDLGVIADSSKMAPEDALQLSLDLLREFALISQEQGLSLKDFVRQLRPRVRAWQKEAAGHTVSLIDAIEDGAKLYHMHGPVGPATASKGLRTFVKSPSTLAILRWASVPPSERSEQARKLAKKRWSKKRDHPKKNGSG